MSDVPWSRIEIGFCPVRRFEMQFDRRARFVNVSPSDFGTLVWLEAMGPNALTDLEKTVTQLSKPDQPFSEKDLPALGAELATRLQRLFPDQRFKVTHANVHQECSCKDGGT